MRRHSNKGATLTLRPAHRRNGGLPADVLMFTRKMPRSNNHLTQIPADHFDVTAQETTVPASECAASITEIASRAPKYLALCDVLKKVVIRLITVPRGEGGELLETE